MEPELDSIYKVVMDHKNGVPLQVPVHFRGICFDKTDVSLDFIDDDFFVRSIPRNPMNHTLDGKPTIQPAEVLKYDMGKTYTVKVIQNVDGTNVVYPREFIVQPIGMIRGIYHMFMDPYTNRIRGFTQNQFESKELAGKIPSVDPNQTAGDAAGDAAGGGAVAPAAGAAAGASAGTGAAAGAGAAGGASAAAGAAAVAPAVSNEKFLLVTKKTNDPTFQIPLTNGTVLEVTSRAPKGSKIRVPVPKSNEIIVKKMTDDKTFQIPLTDGRVLQVESMGGKGSLIRVKIPVSKPVSAPVSAPLKTLLEQLETKNSITDDSILTHVKDVKGRCIKNSSPIKIYSQDPEKCIFINNKSELNEQLKTNGYTNHSLVKITDKTATLTKQDEVGEGEYLIVKLKRTDYVLNVV